MLITKDSFWDAFFKKTTYEDGHGSFSKVAPDIFCYNSFCFLNPAYVT